MHIITLTNFTVCSQSLQIITEIQMQFVFTEIRRKSENKSIFSMFYS